MADLTLLPDPTCLHLLQLEAEGKVTTVTVATTAQDTRCSLCACSSEKVHSRYVRNSGLSPLDELCRAARVAYSTIFLHESKMPAQNLYRASARCCCCVRSQDAAVHRGFDLHWVRIWWRGRQTLGAGNGHAFESRYLAPNPCAGYLRHLLKKGRV